jgi:hypothetical protein
MDNNTKKNMRQMATTLKPYEEATLKAVQRIEQDYTAPDNIEDCEDWLAIVETLRDAALDGPDKLEATKIAMFRAEPRFATAYAAWSPNKTPDQTEDKRLVTLDSGQSAFRVVKVGELKKVKRAHWSIAGILQERTVSLIYGDAGVGKTFITLDLALHLAIGIDWKGRAVRSAMNVLYIYGEGDAGLRDRIGAWQQHYKYSDQALDNAYFVPFPVQAAQENAILCATIEQIGEVGLVVFDTFSMCSSGVNENDNTAVAEWMNAAHALKNRYGCMVIIVHHIGKSGDYRGASSFKGNIDSMICATVGEDGTTIQVESKKQRDGANFETFYLERRTINLGLDDETLEPITSCIVLSVDRDAQVREKMNGEQLVLMIHIAANPGITENELIAFALPNKISKQKCKDRVAYMVKNELVEIVIGKRNAKCASLTVKGQNTLAAAAVDGEV